MRIFKTFTTLTVGVLSVLSISTVMNLHKANAQAAADNEQALCRKSVTGTYLITLTNASGNFASRSLITLTAEGNFIFNDSNQGGISGIFNPFTTGQGTWKCTGKKEVAARALDFSLSDQGGTGIARNDYKATFNTRTNTVTGTINLQFFDLQADPLEGDIQSGTITFTGQRVTAK
ncbi:MAG: hypothetical protein DSM106950_04160 [Stigonema ocellatum SAG 48.90 = DSM 106950]|nr:hypothetical protein [Stigonema ocellatum SAG 48.90 = DSM 106950]